jgi:L-lactate dehydrogenase complex protein LldG
MTARDQILGRLKRGLGRDRRPTDAAEARFQARQAGIIPERGADKDPQAKFTQFADEAGKVDATIQRIATLAELPGAVADYLAGHNLPKTVRVAPSLESAPWETQPMLERDVGIAAGADTVGLSRAFAGVAETGTLVFLSGPDNPTTVNFLPPTHIAVLRAGDLAGSYEQVWARVRAESGENAEKTQLPRTVNWITGPSRTADIEQTLLLGAHGPQRLHIVVVDDDT